MRRDKPAGLVMILISMVLEIIANRDSLVIVIGGSVVALAAAALLVRRWRN
jgi:hypothetical protein